MIYLLIIHILFSVAEAYEDSEYTVILDHNPTVYPRLAYGACLVFLWSAWHGLSLIKVAEFAFILASTFWFVFELAGNLFRGNYFYYIGTTSWLDRRLKPYEHQMFMVRMVLPLIAIILYYYNEILSTYL